MSSFVKEFKAFALRGNVMDMAVGIVIGAAFGLIVSSLVADVVMPPIGLLIGGVDFSGLALTLKQATLEQAAVTLNYGHFLQTVIDFLVVALAVFMAIKGMNVMRRKKEQEAPAAPPAPTTEEKLLTEIRDLLKQR
jgi:large conductance mechanosensitive channel